MSVRFYTGDEVGLVKVITLLEPKEKIVKDDNKRLKLDKPKLPKKTADIEVETTSVVQSWGSIRKTNAIQLMTWGSVDFDACRKQVVVARQSGIVQYISTDDGSVLHESSLFKPAVASSGKPILNKHRKQEHFIGLHDFNGSLITCTDTGILRCSSVNSSPKSETSKNLNQDRLFRMRVHPGTPNLFATGGDERDLAIYDLNSNAGSPETLTANWSAKNIKHDVLDMRVPIWITDLQWFDRADPSKLVVGTGLHHIRLYDTRAARRPVLNLEIGELPVRSLSVIPGRNEVVFSDTSGLIIHADLRFPVGKSSHHPDNPSSTTRSTKTKNTKQYAVVPTHGAVLGSYRGSTGSVTDISIGSKITPGGLATEGIGMVTIGIDRMMRIFDVSIGSSPKGKSRKESQKVYLKTRLTALLVDEEWEGEKKFGDQEKINDIDESEDDEEMWSKMKSVKNDSDGDDSEISESKNSDEIEENDSDEDLEEYSKFESYYNSISVVGQKI
ncbi:WD repeat-containing protein 74 [Nowakowskiella sp. JEL0078]|nr:WD repeat-containing protein 74 [Nowakowskiella sp. JEL0078]